MSNDSTPRSGSAASASNTPADKPWLTPGYVLFLSLLKRCREQRGLDIETLADRLGLAVPLVERYEAGDLPQDVLQTRTWCMALDVPVSAFTAELDDLLSSTLDRDEVVTTPAAPQANDDKANDAADTDDEDASEAPKEPTIQVLVLVPEAAPRLEALPNTLEAMQALVEGLIEPFETGIPGTIGVANEEALLESMPLNLTVPATGAPIFGPLFIAGDAPPNFRSLTPHELEQALDAFALGLSQADFTALMRSHPDGVKWMDDWE